MRRSSLLSPRLPPCRPAPTSPCSLPSVTGASECRDALKNLVIALQAGTEPATALADCVAVCNAALQGK